MVVFLWILFVVSLVCYSASEMSCVKWSVDQCLLDHLAEMFAVKE